MEILLFIFAEEGITALPSFSLVWWIIGVLVMGALAFLGLMAKHKTEVYVTQKEVSEANKELARAREDRTRRL